MCPSYMVTREEKHSTRGRSRLLFEMLEGNPLDEGWRRRGGEGRARPVPRVQGVPRRVSGERRHGDVQGGVSVALLRRTPAAGRGVRVRADALVGARSRRIAPRLANFFTQTPGAPRARQGGGRRWRRSGAFRRSRAQTFRDVVRASVAPRERRQAAR